MPKDTSTYRPEEPGIEPLFGQRILRSKVRLVREEIFWEKKACVWLFSQDVHPVLGFSFKPGGVQGMVTRIWDYTLHILTHIESYMVSNIMSY